MANLKRQQVYHLYISSTANYIHRSKHAIFLSILLLRQSHKPSYQSLSSPLTYLISYATFCFPLQILLLWHHKVLFLHCISILLQWDSECGMLLICSIRFRLLHSEILNCSVSYIRKKILLGGQILPSQVYSICTFL